MFRSLTHPSATIRSDPSKKHEITMHRTRARRSQRVTSGEPIKRSRTAYVPSRLKQPGKLVCPKCVTVTIIGEKVEFLHYGGISHVVAHAPFLAPSRFPCEKKRNYREPLLNPIPLDIITREYLHSLCIHAFTRPQEPVVQQRFDVSIPGKADLLCFYSCVSHIYTAAHLAIR